MLPVWEQTNFSNFGSLKSTETSNMVFAAEFVSYFSNFGSLKSTETARRPAHAKRRRGDFSNFGSLKSTETLRRRRAHEMRETSAISAR